MRKITALSRHACPSICPNVKHHLRQRIAIVSSSQRYLSSTSTNHSTKGVFQWPSSFKDFVSGTPIVVRGLPYIGKISIDFGTSMMNFGAITSLSGFMMTDVFYLRALSILGSGCGITYNVTRTPKQLNAVAWGCVFIGVNLVQIIRLLNDQKIIKFSVEEGALFYKHFQPMGVDPSDFRKLTKVGKWKSFAAGEKIVEEEKALKDVIILVKGTATCQAGESGEELYSYKETENGSIIGGTALVDPTILGRAYPNRIIANENAKVLSFDTVRLEKHLNGDGNKACKAAFLEMMYVDLIGALRRTRSVQSKSGGMGMALHDLKVMLQQACVTGVIHPLERRSIREFMEEKGISRSQLIAMLKTKEIGWTEKEWEDGAKHDNVLYDENKALNPLDRDLVNEFLKTRGLDKLPKYDT